MLGRRIESSLVRREEVGMVERTSSALPCSWCTGSARPCMNDWRSMIQDTATVLILRSASTYQKHAIIELYRKVYSHLQRQHQRVDILVAASASSPPWLSHLYTPDQCELPDDSSSSHQRCAVTSGQPHPHQQPLRTSKESQKSMM
jgi:hypothetical protein